MGGWSVSGEGNGGSSGGGGPCTTVNGMKVFAFDTVTGFTDLTPALMAQGGPSVALFTSLLLAETPELYIGGGFTTAGGFPIKYLAKWDGTSWSALGSGVSSQVQALTVFDDGTGPGLYAGGFFTTAGDDLASFVAKWDGNAWSPVGSAVGFSVRAFTVFDDGSGPALYAAGGFGPGSVNSTPRRCPPPGSVAVSASARSPH